MQSKQLLDALKQLGIADKDIETISYTITPQYEYVNDKALRKDTAWSICMKLPF